MPLESITCTHCGSSEVQEFKAGTFVCSHCEGVFKHLDPTTLTVSQEPAFCSCGATVDYKCSLCDKGVCYRHEWQDKTSGAHESPIHRVLSERFPGGYRVCLECAASLAREIADDQDEGSRCPTCASANVEETCECCSCSFCSDCVQLSTFAVTSGDARSPLAVELRLCPRCAQVGLVRFVASCTAECRFDAELGERLQSIASKRRANRNRYLPQDHRRIRALGRATAEAQEEYERSLMPVLRERVIDFARGFGPGRCSCKEAESIPSERPSPIRL